MKMLTETLQVKLFTIIYHRMVEFLCRINFKRRINLLSSVKNCTSLYGVYFSAHVLLVRSLSNINKH